jgi:hypothetical protein
MSSPTYYNEYDSETEQYGEIEQDSFEEYEPYMTYDEEMAAFEDSDNYIFEDEYADAYTDDAYVN